MAEKERLMLLKRTLQKGGFDASVLNKLSLEDSESSLNSIEDDLKSRGIDVPQIVLEPNITKAEVLGLAKMLIYILASIVGVLFFVYVIGNAVDITILKESLALVGINIDNIISSSIRISIAIILLAVAASALMIFLNLYKKTFYFYKDRLEYRSGSKYIKVPYSDVVAVNYLKKLFGGDTVILKLTGGETQKIEVNFINNVETNCLKINEIVTKFKRPWLESQST